MECLNKDEKTKTKTKGQILYIRGRDNHIVTGDKLLDIMYEFMDQWSFIDTIK